jgi:hypothetical protein
LHRHLVSEARSLTVKEDGMKCSRCPFHVRQGQLASSGQIEMSDICGVKTANGASCSFAPFKDSTFKNCDHYMVQMRGAERQVLIPKNDIEYLPEFGGLASFSEMELM